MIVDKDGYRLNVGIIISNSKGKLFWGKRLAHDAWQFPQGGLDKYESAEQALFRELREEVGLEPEDVEILGVTRRWLRYRLPKQFVRRRSKPLVIGQRQKWFLLRLKSSEQKIQLDLSHSPEFDSWRWVDYWYPLEHVINFKQEIYKLALAELEPFLVDKTPTSLPPESS